MTEETPATARTLPIGLEQPLEFYSLLLRRSALYTVGTQSLLAVTAALILAILLDALWISEAAKWWASLIFYGAVSAGLVFLFASILLPKRVSHVSLARKIEARSRRMRDLLVAAIELSENPSPGCSDAMVRAVQDDAQQSLESIDIRSLVSSTPQLRFRRQVWLTFGVLLASLVVPGIFMRVRLTRVVLPMLDVGRVSWIAIAIPQPRPSTIARGDVVRINADFAGPWQGRATLEIRTSGDRDLSAVTRLAMTKDREVDGRAVRQVSIKRPAAEYRVVSQNAWSPWYPIQTLVRPQTTKLCVTSLLPDDRRTVDAESGDTATRRLTVLTRDKPIAQIVKGSSVQIAVTSNIPVEIAQMHFPQDGDASAENPTQQDAKADDAELPPSKPEIVEHPLQAANAERTQWQYGFTADASTSFRIHLVGGPKALTNRFAPTFRIEVVEDLAPSLAWVKPTATKQLVTANQVVELEVTATDEQPLDAVWLSCEFERREHQRIDLAAVPRPGDSDKLRQDSSIRYALNLSELNVKFGDRLKLFVSARDHLGQSAETTPQSLHVVQQLAKPLGGRNSAELFGLADKLDGYARKLSGAANSESPPAMQREVIDGLRRDSRQLLSSVFSAANRAELRSALAQESVIAAADMLAEQSVTLTAEYARLASKESTKFVSPSRALERQAQRAIAVSEAFRSVVEIDLASQIADSASIVHQQLLALRETLERYRAQSLDAANTSDGAATETIVSISSQHHVLVLQAEQFAKQLADIFEMLGESRSTWLEGHYRQLRFLVDRQRSSTTELNQRLLDHQIAQLATSFEALSNPLQLLPNRIRLLEEASSTLAKSSVHSAEAVEEFAEHVAAQIASSKGATSVEVLYAVANSFEVQRSMRRLLRPGKASLSADLGAAQRATLAQIEDSNLTRVTKGRNFRVIDDAIVTLRAAASLDTALAELQSITPEDQARDAVALGNRLQVVGFHIRLAHAITRRRHRGVATALADSQNNLEHLVSQFEDDGASPTKVVALRESVLSDLLAAKQIFTPSVSDARNALRRLTPSLETLASRAALKANQLQLLTSDLATEAQRGGVDEMRGDVAALSSELTRRASPTRQLHDALVDLAESQDLLDTTQLKLARAADTLSRPVSQALQQQLRSLDSVDAKAREEALVEQLRQGASEQASAAERLARVERELRQQLGQFLAEERREQNRDELVGDGSGPTEQSDELQQSQEAGQENATVTANAQPTAEAVAPNQTLGQTTGSGGNGRGQPSRSEDGPGGESNAHNATGESAEQTEEAYRAAQQLAEFVQLDPVEMLAQLEAYLPHSSAMQSELSTITEMAIAEAEAGLTLSGQQQLKYFELAQQSDPRVQTKGDIQERIVSHAIKELREVSLYLIRQLVTTNARILPPGRLEAEQKNLADWTQLLQSIERRRTMARNKLRTANQAELLAHLNSVREELQRFHDRLLKLLQSRMQRKASGQQKEVSETESRSYSDHYRRVQQTVLRSRRELLRELQLDEKHVRSTISRLEVSQTKLSNLLRRTQRAPRQEWLEATKAQLAKEQERVADFLEQKMSTTRKTVFELSAAPDNATKLDLLELSNRLLEILGHSLEQLAEQLAKFPDASNDETLTLSRWAAFETDQLFAARAAAQSASQNVLRAGRHDLRLANASPVNNAVRRQRSSATDEIGESARQIDERGIQALIQALQQIQATSPEQAGREKALVDPAVGQAIMSELKSILRTTADTEADLQRIRVSFGQLGEPLADNQDSGRSIVVRSVRDRNEKGLHFDRGAIERQLKTQEMDSVDAPNSSRIEMEPPVPLPPRELALLVDQLDRMLHGDGHLGEADNDFEAASSSSGQSTPGQISAAAQQLAEQLSVARTQATQSAPTDRGQATSSGPSEAAPEVPSPYQFPENVLSDLSLDGNWANLRERNDERASQQATPSVPIEYRDIVEGYFRRLGELTDRNVN